MQSLIRDIKGLDASGPVIEDGGKASSRLISEMVSSTKASSKPERENQPQSGQSDGAPSIEDQQQMLTFLMTLEELRQSDPAAFEQAMTQLGIGGAQSDTGNDKEQSQTDALKTLISSLKSGVAGGVSSEGDPGIVLPGASNKSLTKGITITPTPGYVIKTRQLADEVKVFINLCSHETLDAPAMKKRLNESGESVEGLNIPMSVGAGRTGLAKEGKTCRVYDIIVNPQVVQDGLDDKSGKYRDFVAQLCIQSVEQKYKSELDRRYKLPMIKNNYMGEGAVEPQTIQDRKAMPRIEEVTADSPAAQSSAAARLKKQAEDAKRLREAMKMVETPLIYRLKWEGGGESGKEESFLPEPSQHQDPVVVAAPGVTDLVLTAELSASATLGPGPLDLTQMQVKVSPFKLSLKVPGHRLATLYLPSAVLPCSARCSLRRKVGYAQRLELVVCMPVDRTPWDSAPDAGSKQWLVTNALRSGDGDDDSFNPYDEQAVAVATAAAAAAATASVSGLASSSSISKQAASEETLPEDRFHIRLPRDVDPYTGQRMASGGGSNGAELDDVELPEDHFHRKDAGSQYLIQQREQSVKDKWDKHEREKAERVNDPNVEYVDVQDFRPGGKLYKPERDGEAEIQGEEPQDAGVGMPLRKASQVVSELVAPTGVTLSSTVWSELCD